MEMEPTTLAAVGRAERMEKKALSPAKSERVEPALSAPGAVGSKPVADRKASAMQHATEERKESRKKQSKKSKKKSNSKKSRHHSSSSDGSSSSSSSDSSSSDSDSSADESYGKEMKNALKPWRYPLYSPSASYRQLDTVSGSHQYTISGFALARAMGCGTRLCSDFFDVAGTLFRLEVYPAGFTADTRKCLSAFLTTPGSISPNHVMFEIAVLDQSGKDKHIVATKSDVGHHRGRGPLIMHCRGIVGAVLRLVKAKDLQEKCKRYLPHDMLVLRTTVHVLRGWSSAPAMHATMVPAVQSHMPMTHALAPSPNMGQLGPGPSLCPSMVSYGSLAYSSLGYPAQACVMPALGMYGGNPSSGYVSAAQSYPATVAHSMFAPAHCGSAYQSTAYSLASPQQYYSAV